MAQPLTQQIIDPHALSEAARERLTDELFAAHERIFAGVDREAFSAYVVCSPARRTRIQVFRAGDQVVGYAAFHVFECAVAGRRSRVLRAEVGLLPAYRRGTRFGWFITREALRAVLGSPGTPVWGLSCATNPATYRTIARHADMVWPHWERPTPPHVEHLMGELAAQFGLRPVEERPGVYHVGWRTRQDEAEALGWQQSTHPAARLYVDRNPGYVDGHGLLLLVPVSGLGMVRACLRLLHHALQRRRRRPSQALAPSMLREVEGR
ncbi:MAG: hypothetical protein KDK70_02020 [Myxococcales bacterium]|nr:hypothetical protein [Myxococcales bacterium]